MISSSRRRVEWVMMILLAKVEVVVVVIEMIHIARVSLISNRTLPVERVVELRWTVIIIISAIPCLLFAVPTVMGSIFLSLIFLSLFNPKKSIIMSIMSAQGVVTNHREGRAAAAEKKSMITKTCHHDTGTLVEDRFIGPIVGMNTANHAAIQASQSVTLIEIL